MTRLPRSHSSPPVFVHATTLTAKDDIPFAHGLSLALNSGGWLYSLHAGAEPDNHSEHLDADALLDRWGVDEVARGDLQVRQIFHRCCDDPTDTLLNALRELEADLVIVGTEGHAGFARLLRGSIAEALALNIASPTLFIPHRGEGFVDMNSGRSELRRVILPVSDPATAEVAKAWALWIARLFGNAEMMFTLLHVDAAAPSVRTESVQVPEGPEEWVWESTLHPGPLPDAIHEACGEPRRSLVVFITHGVDSLRDLIQGSHTQQWVRQAECAVLSVPA